jgi:iron(III) transport system ATP-binding protein
MAARIDELLTLVGLPGSNAKFPAQLSGGQQQRVALARALATAPGLLLLDEPLSALDALERVRLRQEIRSLQRTLGVTTIMVTHDQEEALSIADRIVVMNHGRIEQVGTPMQVYREPSTPFVADFVGKINVLSARLQPGRRLVIGETRFECEHDAAAERDVKVYLRPEDVLARPIAAGDANVFMAVIEKIEFLGSYCLVRVGTQGLAGQPVTVYLSLNFLAEQGLAVGSRLPLRLLPDRMRLF